MARPMHENVDEREDRAKAREEAFRHAQMLVGLGEAKTAVDLMRREVSRARTSLPPASLPLLRVLSQYAEILESTDALAEAEFIRAEALEIVGSAQLTTRDAAEAVLCSGLLLCKMHNYDGALARLQEAVQRAETLDGVDELDRQIILARAWRSQAQALEALGEFSQASNALDVLQSVKRSIRFTVFSP
jgi:tetratricopeptide (TPR) repeat protein